MNVALIRGGYGSSAYTSMSSSPITALNVVTEAQEVGTKDEWGARGIAVRGEVQKLSHVKLRSAGEEATVILHRALADKGRLTSPSWVGLWHERSDHSVSAAWAPANRYLCWWAPLPGATSTPAWIPCPLFSTPLTIFCHCVMSNHCQVADCTPPKYKGIRFQDTDRNEYNNGIQN